jgi:cell cycle sensor histidine kinase DivJ
MRRAALSLQTVTGLAPVRAGERFERLRQRAVFIFSLVLAGAAAAGLPAALVLIASGSLVTMVVCLAGFAIAGLALGLLRAGQRPLAEAVEVFGIQAAGIALSIVEPAFVDFGLATALLAPILASIFGRIGLSRWSWGLMAATLLVGGLASSAVFAAPADIAWLSGGTYVAAALAVALTAHVVNADHDRREKAQRNAYRHLVETLRDAVIRFDLDGGIIAVSTSAEALFGAKRYDLTADGLVERVHVLDRPAYLKALDEVRTTLQHRIVEVRMRKDDAAAKARSPRFVWIELAFSSVFDPDFPDLPQEIVAVLRDVSVRRADRDALTEARDAADEALKAKSAFLATIGHELRTPLNAIVGFSEMMTNGIGGELAPGQKEYAALIAQSGHHLLDVVNMLLDMARLEAGRLELQVERFSPDGIVAPCLQMIDKIAADRRITISAELAPTLPAIAADERACRQILINLLSNAVKFSHEGGAVKLAMKRQGRNLKISVHDDGIGMSAEDVARIGEAFFQAHGGTGRRYEGAGLGLSIVKGLAELHGGSLHVVSAPGEGTTVSILLPINGPETKSEHTEPVTPIHRAPVPGPEPEPAPQWQDRKRNAR